MRNKMFIMAFVILISTAAMASPQVPQAQHDGKNNVEQLIKTISKIESSEIDYTYVSTAMISKMFKMLPDIGELYGLKNVRAIETTGLDGYIKVKKMIEPFLNEDEEVMGLSLQALERNGGKLNVCYANNDYLLMVNDDGEITLSITLLKGLSFDMFKKMQENGFELEIDF